jgi:hypothetical protein
MDKKKKNLQEMYKLGFSQKTLSLLSESQIEMILEKIKKKETKEAQTIQTSITKYTPSEVESAKRKGESIPGGRAVKMNPDGSMDVTNEGEMSEGKKKKKKYNPWAVCTASVGRKNKKKYEDCVMGVKKKLKEGRSPYEYLIESKMEEIVENNLSPKMSKGELLRIIAEKKMMMKKPIGKTTVLGGEIGEDTKTAPAPTRTTPKTEPGTRPSHPGRRSKEQPNPKPKAKKSQSNSEMESKKNEIINAIFNLIDKESK